MLFGLTWFIQSIISRTRSESANHYTTDALQTQGKQQQILGQQFLHKYQDRRLHKLEKLVSDPYLLYLANKNMLKLRRVLTMFNMWITYGKPRLYSNGEFDLNTKPLWKNNQDVKVKRYISGWYVPTIIDVLEYYGKARLCSNSKTDLITL
jgi:hypothetical protein